MRISFSSQHFLKEQFSMPATLYRLMYVEVKHAKRVDFFDLPTLCRDEQFSLTDFQKTNHSVSLPVHAEVKPLLMAKKSERARDSLRELLSLGAGGAHIVNDHCKLISLADRRRTGRRTWPLAEVH